MTAIVAYINKSNAEDISLLAADDLEVISRTKVDKLTKINSRFTLGIVGLQAVHWAIEEGIAYFNSFNGIVNIETIGELETELTTVISFAFRKWTETNTLSNIKDQLNITSIIIVMDCIEKCIYSCDIGKAWGIPTQTDWEVKFNKICENGLYVFGIPAENEIYIIPENVGAIPQNIHKEMNDLFSQYSEKYKSFVGQYGCNQFSKNESSTFNSCFNSYCDYITNQIARRKFEAKNQIRTD